MKTFSYWIAECLNDSECYSVIGRTKKEVRTQLDQRSDRDSFGDIKKKSIKYTDVFDLFEWVTSEGGGRNCGT